MTELLPENEAKDLLVTSAKKQLQEIRQATVDMRQALKTDNDEQIKFVIATIRLVHDYIFDHAPRIAAKNVLEKKYNH